MGLAEKINAKFDKAIEKSKAREEYHKAQVEYHKEKIEELENNYILNEVINGINYGVNIKVSDNTITIIPTGNKYDVPVEIPKSDVIEVKIFDSKKVEVRNKSVIGRAVVGGALLGGIGAVIGGMSGTTPKTTESIETHLTITYKNGNDTVCREFRKFVLDSGVKQIYEVLTA